MRNYIQPGNIIDVVTPAGGMVAGRGYVLGSLFGVAAATAVEGAVNSLHTTGVYVFEEGGLRPSALHEVAYFDIYSNSISPEPLATLFKIGVIVGLIPSGPGTPPMVEVRLSGTDVVAVAD